MIGNQQQQLVIIGIVCDWLTFLLYPEHFWLTDHEKPEENQLKHENRVVFFVFSPGLF